MRLVLATALLLMATPAQSQTEGKTVERLRQLCVSEGPKQSSFCLGYLSGVADPMEIAWLMTKNPVISMCGSASYAAVIQAFVNWADKHPEKWGDDRATGATLALRETWPCK